MSTKNISIIPNPLLIAKSAGWFELRPETVIKVTKELLPIGKYLQEYLVFETGFTLEIEETEEKNDRTNEIFLSIDEGQHDLGDEGYLLKADTDGVSIRAAQTGGYILWPPNPPAADPKWP